MEKINIEQFRKFFPEEEVSSLYDYQVISIEKLINKRNCLTIVPTGGGKSLIYQLAGLALPGVTIVISPLKALMQEQVSYLQAKNINTLTINSDTSFKDQRKVLRNLGELNIKFLFVSPEKLQDYFFQEAIIFSKILISLLTIDEAHCISQWGHDFRPEYNEITRFISFLQDNNQTPTICALTATLSKKAAFDIKNEFQISDDIIISKTGLFREELKIEIIKVSNSRSQEEKIEQIIKFISNHNSKKVLIYLYSRNKAEELSQRFNDEEYISDMKSDYFHADIDSQDKKQKYEDFKSGRTKILFATTAFGMGLNIPDIDTIIQYHLPKSIEEYYQQVGRGARNKAACPICNCLLFWSEDNLRANINEIESEVLSQEDIELGLSKLSIENKINKISAVTFKELSASNLRRLKFYFERLKIIETIGEINGAPDQIRFFYEPEEWIKIKNANEKSFILASKILKTDIVEIIKYVYRQDLQGRIEFLPALDKNIYIKQLNIIDKHCFDFLIKDSKQKVEYKKSRFLILEDFCKTKNYQDFLNDVFSEIEEMN